MRMKRNEIMQKVALRYQAVYLEVERNTLTHNEPTADIMAFARRLAECGYCLSEELLHALSHASINVLSCITDSINQALGVSLNWMPLVKEWGVPTNENILDHLITLLANCYNIKDISGTKLSCGHIIPEGTFPIERYNGCPFCGNPFRTSDFVYKGHGSKLKELRLFTESDMQQVFLMLLTSPTPLNATQLDSLKLLVEVMDIPSNATITIRENVMIVIHALLKQGKEEEVLTYLKTPTDILRYLWFEKTGKAIIIRPKAYINNARKWRGVFMDSYPKTINECKEQMQNRLKLKYNRIWCRRVAQWLNALPIPAVAAAENMHPYRGMWVRFIRALRLAEYAKKPGYDKLAKLMDIFYKQDYLTFGSELNHAINMRDMHTTLDLLSSRPGLFARCLFATMLRFGTIPVLESFKKVANEVPIRLVYSLMNSAELYFNPQARRYAHPITGGMKPIKPNQLLKLYSQEELEKMIQALQQLFLDVMSEHYAAHETVTRYMYIDPMLYDIPLSIGDRATTIQDAACALQGTRFPVEGNQVRLFMQWGEGLPAQHLDMDLSCRIMYENRNNICAYHNLSFDGVRHSGDIRDIPHKVGTAEYIDLNLDILRTQNAQYAIFMCNAYSYGGASPNMKVGWMNSAYPMAISQTTGVAYDPSCVQHIVRISENNIAKGLTFGVLDIVANEIIWLEITNSNQVACLTNTNAIIQYLQQLRNKCSVGQLLEIKAKAQSLALVENVADADEVYTYEWALNPAAVSNLLV